MCVRSERSSAYHPQSPAAISIKPDTRLWTWKRKRYWTSGALCRLDSSPTPQYDSELDLGSPEAQTPVARNPAKTRNRSCRDSCYRRLPSRTARTKGSFTTGQACRGISCADQTASACEEFRKQNARSRFENSLAVLGAARAIIPAQGSGPRRVSPCRPQCLSTNSAGSQIKCLGMGARAGQTAPAPGGQTASTTRNRLECAQKKDSSVQTKCQKTAHQPDAFPGLCCRRARVSVFLDPKQLFPSEQQTAHISA